MLEFYLVGFFINMYIVYNEVLNTPTHCGDARIECSLDEILIPIFSSWIYFIYKLITSWGK